MSCEQVFKNIINKRWKENYDLTKKENKEHIHSLVISYQANQEDQFFLEIVEAHTAMFVKRTAKMNGYHNKAELLSDLFVACHEAMLTWEKDKSDFSFFLSKKLFWCYTNHLRGKVKRDGEDLMDGFDIPEVVVEDEEPISFIAARYLDVLTVKQRVLVEKLVFENLTLADACEQLGFSYRTGAKLIQDSRERLRDRGLL